jgi:Na+/proline symporter
LRPWPWILVGLAALSLFNVETHTPVELKKELQQVRAMDGYSPKWLSGEASPSKFTDATKVLIVREGLRKFAGNNPRLAEAINYEINPRFGYIYAMKHFLPKGWMGLMLVAFFSAYMSTISTQLNWGASYLINDVWLRIKKKPAKDKAIIQNSRWLLLILALLSLLISTQIESISGVWKFIMECGAGLGLVLILRWFWGRINAWVEITATITPFIGYAISRYFFHLEFPHSFFFTVSLTTISWVVVLVCTKESKQWGNFKSQVFKNETTSISVLLLRWVLAVISAYSLLFGIGASLLHGTLESILYFISSIISALLLIKSYNKQPILD